jgi:GR25 family glycosyltransferase involved in LPS biosynthesis
MNQNKAEDKLQGFPPVYYINLDEQTERASYMEAQLRYWGVENWQRISAHDGRDGKDLSHLLRGQPPEQMHSGEIGCVTSHLKAIEHFLSQSDAPCAIIMEDDCDLGVAHYWPFAWREFFAQIPYDYDVIQLAIINPVQVYLQLHRRFVNDFSTACYLITRHYAQKLVNLHVRGAQYQLDQGVLPRAVADDLIYNAGNTFAIPLFAFNIQFKSTIHADHVATLHRNSHDGIWHFWRNEASKVPDWHQVFHYNPYAGRLAPSIEKQ